MANELSSVNGPAIVSGEIAGIFHLSSSGMSGSLWFSLFFLTIYIFINGTTNAQGTRESVASLEVQREDLAHGGQGKAHGHLSVQTNGEQSGG